MTYTDLLKAFPFLRDPSNTKPFHFIYERSISDINDEPCFILTKPVQHFMDPVYSMNPHDVIDHFLLMKKHSRVEHELVALGSHFTGQINSSAHRVTFHNEMGDLGASYVKKQYVEIQTIEKANSYGLSHKHRLHSLHLTPLTKSQKTLIANSAKEDDITTTLWLDKKPEDFKEEIIRDVINHCDEEDLLYIKKENISIFADNVTPYLTLGMLQHIRVIENHLDVARNDQIYKGHFTDLLRTEDYNEGDTVRLTLDLSKRVLVLKDPEVIRTFDLRALLSNADPGAALVSCKERRLKNESAI